MYLQPTLTTVVESLRTIFDGSYPNPDFRNVNVTIEFPYLQQDYPGIWVQFDDDQDLERAGINHIEVTGDADTGFQQVTRYRFGGSFSFTCAALSAQERNRLYDEMVRVLAFSFVDDSPAGRFKSLVEQNDLIGIVFDYDILTPSGNDVTPGTPWNTAEVMYERTISIKMVGEFVSDPTTGDLLVLSNVVTDGWVEGDPTGPDFPLTTTDPSIPWDPTQWS